MPNGLLGFRILFLNGCLAFLLLNLGLFHLAWIFTTLRVYKEKCWVFRFPLELSPLTSDSNLALDSESLTTDIWHLKFEFDLWHVSPHTWPLILDLLHFNPLPLNPHLRSLRVCLWPLPLHHWPLAFNLWSLTPDYDIWPLTYDNDSSPSTFNSIFVIVKFG